MEVTDIRLNLINKEGGVKAIGSFSLDHAFAIRGVRIMEDKNGRNFVAFPSREKTNGEYEDIAFPLSKEFYHTVTEALVNEYKAKKEQQESQAQEQNQEQEKTQAQEQEATQTQEETQTESAPRRGRSK